MGPRIAIVGGGSFQWVPKLLVDLANTPTLHDAHVVQEDVDPAPLPPMVELVELVASVRGIGLSAESTTDQRGALADDDALGRMTDEMLDATCPWLPQFS